MLRAMPLSGVSLSQTGVRQRSTCLLALRWTQTNHPFQTFLLMSSNRSYDNGQTILLLALLFGYISPSLTTSPSKIYIYLKIYIQYSQKKQIQRRKSSFDKKSNEKKDGSSHSNRDTSSKGYSVGTGAVLISLSLLLKRY